MRIYACGGDGTVHEVANGIAGYDKRRHDRAFPPAPAMTFSKTSARTRPNFLTRKISGTGRTFPLDLIDCNGRYCLTIACSGIDARIADSVHRYGGPAVRPGELPALRGGELPVQAPSAAGGRVELDGEVLEDDFALVSMCNGRYYGGGSMPVPEARMDDGVLQTILVKNVPEATFARLFPAYSAGDCWKLPRDRPGGDGPAGEHHRLPRRGGHRHLPGRGEHAEPIGHPPSGRQAGELLRPRRMLPNATAQEPAARPTCRAGALAGSPSAR